MSTKIFDYSDEKTILAVHDVANGELSISAGSGQGKIVSVRLGKQAAKELRDALNAQYPLSATKKTKAD